MNVRIIAPIVLIGAICVVIIPLMMRSAVSQYMYTDASSTPSAQAAMILGASVVRGKPSPILAERADGAIALYKAGKVSKILVTGDNGEQRYDEVTPVRKYLTDAGIPDNDIFLDHAGFDTYSSMYRAQSVFQAQSLVVVTQDFHMPRALFIARHLGLNAFGFVVQGQNPETWEYLREIPASVKALFDVYTSRMPRYLGEPIPLTGVGTTTWY
jgi:SanA protein